MSGLHTIDIEAEEPQSASAGRHGRAGAPLLGRTVQEYHGPWSERWRGGLRRLTVSPARRCRTGEDSQARSEPLSVAAGEEGPGGARRRCGARTGSGRGGPGRADGGGSGGGGGSTKGPGVRQRLAGRRNACRRSDHLQALCVRCFQPSHSLRLCSWLVWCLASLCIPCAVAVLLCLRARCSVLGTPFLAFSFGRGAVTEVLHALRCGLALSPVRHDLLCKKKGGGAKGKTLPTNSQPSSIESTLAWLQRAAAATAPAPVPRTAPALAGVGGSAVPSNQSSSPATGVERDCMTSCGSVKGVRYGHPCAHRTSKRSGEESQRCPLQDSGCAVGRRRARQTPKQDSRAGRIRCAKPISARLHKVSVTPRHSHLLDAGSAKASRRARETPQTGLYGRQWAQAPASNWFPGSRAGSQTRNVSMAPRNPTAGGLRGAKLKGGPRAQRWRCRAGSTKTLCSGADLANLARLRSAYGHEFAYTSSKKLPRQGAAAPHAERCAAHPRLAWWPYYMWVSMERWCHKANNELSDLHNPTPMQVVRAANSVMINIRRHLEHFCLCTSRAQTVGTHARAWRCVCVIYIYMPQWQPVAACALAGHVTASMIDQS